MAKLWIGRTGYFFEEKKKKKKEKAYLPMEKV